MYGARPVKRALQRELQTLLAQALLRNDFEEEDTVVVKANRCGGGPRGGGGARQAKEPEVPADLACQGSHLPVHSCWPPFLCLSFLWSFPALL